MARPVDLGLAGTDFQTVPLDATSLIVRYTLKGDRDLNGTVNFDDLLRLAKSYGATTGKFSTSGDSDHDGNVDFDDLLAVMAVNYNRTLSTADAASSAEVFANDWALAQAIAPEPSTLGVLLLAFRRNRRSRQSLARELAADAVERSACLKCLSPA
ncbi:MAG: hypothetical protein QM751_07610 [Paludibacteraceae bacterium]